MTTVARRTAASVSKKHNYSIPIWVWSNFYSKMRINAILSALRDDAVIVVLSLLKEIEKLSDPLFVMANPSNVPPGYISGVLQLAKEYARPLFLFGYTANGTIMDDDGIVVTTFGGVEEISINCIIGLLVTG